MSRECYGVAIIGAGSIGRKRAESIINANYETELVAICDIDINKARNFANKYKIDVCLSWKDLIDNNNIDTVVVSTPNKYLTEISIEALKKNKHVLCEKPLGRNFKESLEIYSEAKQRNRILKSGLNHRHHPAVNRAKKIVDNGDIGNIYYLRCIYGHGGRPGYEKEWRASKELCGGGELLDQGVHVVDLFRWFLGEFYEAYGQINTYYWNMEIEDNAFAMFKTKNRQVALMHTSWTQWRNKFLFEIFGEKGYLIVEGLGGNYGTEKLIIGKRRIKDRCGISDTGYRKQRHENRNAKRARNVEYEEGAPEEEVIEFPGPDVSWAEEWEEFISAIIENREPLGSGYDGLIANQMIEAVYRSARLNKPVKIFDVG